MPFPQLSEPTRYAGDRGSPFASGGPLRVLLDLPADLRQLEAGPWEGPIAPTPEHLVWSLCQGSTDIELTWLAGPGETGAGAVHFQEPHLPSDHWPFRIERNGGETLGAVSMYRQLVRAADEDPLRALDSYAKAALSRDLRAHVTVTQDLDLLNLTGFYARNINPMTAVDALAVVGLYLRKDDPFLGAWAPKGGLNLDHHLTAWVAVRSQLPSGWRWGSALVDHSTATDDDYATLLFGSFFERLVRMLNHRDDIHRAVLQRADNQTGLDATEALDTFMFNVVGAFDAAAIAAHMGAGRQFADRRRAGWQSKDWRKELGVQHLYEMFHKNKPADDLFAVCRLLRNTVHGAGLSSMVVSSISSRKTLVRLPHAEAAEIVGRLDHLAPVHTWGIDELHRGHLYIDPSRLVEGLIPHIFSTLDEVLAHTPLDGLTGTGVVREDIPIDGFFDISTRTRTCLLTGLNPPSD